MSSYAEQLNPVNSLKTGDWFLQCRNIMKQIADFKMIINQYVFDSDKSHVLNKIILISKKDTP